MSSVLLILGAVVAGWMVQLYFTYLQSVRFNGDVVRLKASGPVTVGVGGNRYRGGRVYVAFAVDDTGPRGRVLDAIVLGGFTTFAKSEPLPRLVDRTVAELAGEADVDGLTRPQRLAARQAAELLGVRDSRKARPATPATPTATSVA